MSINQKHPKHLARRCAMQGLYQWSQSETTHSQLLNDCLSHASEGVDSDYVVILLEGALDSREKIEALLNEFGSRQSSTLNPVENAILHVAVYELIAQPAVPYRVVINEAVEIAKTFGSPDGFKYVNAVLNAMVKKIRPNE